MSIIITQPLSLSNETTFCFESIETAHVIKKRSYRVDSDDEKTMPKGFAYLNNALRPNEITICECLSINDQVCMFKVRLL